MSMLERIHKAAVKKFVKGLVQRTTDVDILRNKLDIMRFNPAPSDVEVSSITMGSVPALKLTPQNAQGAMLYLHGGGYCVGSAASHKDFVARFAKTTQRQAFSLDYRMAPEHSAPAARDDALESYKILLESHDDIVIAGDSAGAALAMGLMQEINALNLSKPKALVLFSPFADVSCSTDTMESHAERDPMLTPHVLKTLGKLYAGDKDTQDPDVSSLFGDFKDFAPSIIIVGSEEVLLGDSLRLEQKLKAENIPYKLSIYDGLWHVFPMHANLLKRSRDALKEARDFINSVG